MVNATAPAWEDEYAEDLLKPLTTPARHGHIPHEDLERFGYTTRTFQDLCMMRSHLDGWRGDFSEEDGHFVMPVEDGTGRAGANIRLGHFKAKIHDESSRILYQALGIPVGLKYKPLKWVPKRNATPALDTIEWSAYQTLAATPGTNVAPMRRTDGTLETKHLKGQTLFEKTEHAHRVQTIYDIYGGGERAPGHEKLIAQYAQLVGESVRSAAALTRDLPAHTKQLAADEAWRSIAERKGLSIAQAKERYAGEHQTRKIMDAYGITDEGFVEAFAPVQDTINEYAANHSIWISDRSPKNRKGQNYDFNKIDEAPITRELTLILDMHPEGLTYEERKDLMERYVRKWNAHTGSEVQMDEAFSRSYASEVAYRALLNAKHSLEDAYKWKRKHVCCDDFFTYARIAEQARNYLEHQAFPALAHLEEIGVLKQGQADRIREHILPAFEQRSDEVGAAMAYRDLTPQQNLALDARIYYLKQPRSWEHVVQHLRREQQQKAVPASTASSHSS